MANSKKIMVERESFDLNGKTCYSYFVKGTVRGREVKAQLAPQDNGGYVLLDIVFDNANTAELVIGSVSITNEKGKTETFPSYTVKNVDQKTGEVFECPVRAARKTDKTKLAMILR